MNVAMQDLTLSSTKFHDYMIKSANLKIERATERIAELSELVEKKPLFQVVAEGDSHGAYGTIWTKRDESAMNSFSLIAGDAIHNLRTALDHAYWDIVHPRAPQATQRQIQFPFSERGNSFKETAQNRLANLVSERFHQAVIDLKPYPEDGRDNLLYLLHRMDIIDRHRFLTPTADYTETSAATIRMQVPGFPSNIHGQIGFGQNNMPLLKFEWVNWDFVGERR